MEMREAALALADWLEGRTFEKTASPALDPAVASTVLAAWDEGYRRAIHELRWAAAEPVVVPDDISELL